MDKKDVEKILEFYLTIKDEIELNLELLKTGDLWYNSLKAQNMDGMPHSTVKSDITAMQAVRAEEYREKVREEIEKRNELLCEVESEIDKELLKLPYRYKKVILCHDLGGKDIEATERRMQYSERQCRTIRRKALNELGRLFGTNQKISSLQI